MCNSDRLTELRIERDALVASMVASGGKLVKRIVVRGREVEYADALQFRKYLDGEIDREERKSAVRSGPARNRARLGRA